MPNFKRIIRLFKWERKSQNTDYRENSDNPETGRDKDLDYERPGFEIHGPLSRADAEQAGYREHERQHRNRQTLTNYFIAGFTAVTAVVGVWQGYLTRDAIRANDRQSAASEESNRVARSSIESNLSQNRRILESSASQTSQVLAEAAAENRNALASASKQQALAFRQGREALDASNKNFRADQRAWVGAIDVTPSHFEISSKGTITAVISNLGKTIGKNIHATAQAQTFGWGSVFVPHFNEIKTERSVLTMFPNMHSTVSAEIPFVFSLQDIRNLESGIVVMRFWGRITYDDNFGVPHWTEFCSYVERDLKTMDNCSTYNDAN